MPLKKAQPPQVLSKDIKKTRLYAPRVPKKDDPKLKKLDLPKTQLPRSTSVKPREVLLPPKRESANSY